MSAYADVIYKQFKEKTDAIIVFIDEDEWEARGLRGRHYVKAYAGYRFAFVKYDRFYARTADHEMMHMLNDLVFIVLGIRLETVIGVADWDEDVVHGRSPRFTRYEHDTAYQIVYPHVKKAAETRRRIWAVGALQAILIQLRALLVELQKRDHVIVDDPEPTNAQKLYDAMIASVGTDASPNDLAPDELGCAETVSEIIKKILPDFPVIPGTWTLWDYFRKSSSFTLVETPEPGDIIISPTGMSKFGSRAPFPGHTGFIGNRNKIYSNSSASGEFEQNFTRESWTGRYVNRGGYPVYYYRIK